MEAARAILTRHSTRKYKDKPVEDDKLARVIEAGRYAPSGSNSQTSHFFVIRDKQVLKQLAEIACRAFSKMEIYEGMYRSLKSAITRAKTGNYVFHHDAPVLIVLANQKDYGNNIADVACALENMMIMANSLDLGSCWINQLKWLNENEEIIRVFESFGMKESERIYGALALGYPDSEDGLPERRQIERKGNEVTYI